VSAERVSDDDTDASSVVKCYDYAGHIGGNLGVDRGVCPPNN